MPTRSEINRRFERMFDPRYNNFQHCSSDEILKDSKLIGFIKDDFENQRETFTRVHEVSDKLPDHYMRVKCSHISSPKTFYNGGTVYFYDPFDKTFRTRRGRNKTHLIHSWYEA